MGAGDHAASRLLALFLHPISGVPGNEAVGQVGEGSHCELHSHTGTRS